MSNDGQRPIIIKRKKTSGGDGHHGGAWKVAYADFVTAMMAFFMLMWLLNATTETQRKGLADYFSPTIAVARVSGGGDGVFGGDSMFSESTLANSGTGGFISISSQNIEEEGLSGNQPGDATSDDELDKVIEGIIGRGGDSMIAEMAMQHIVTRVTDEGLVVEIFDLDGEPLFEPGSARPTPILKEIVSILTDVFVLVENKLSVAAHSRSYTPVLLSNPAWGLTTERAHGVRTLFGETGFSEDRILRLTGFGQQKPLLTDPMLERNNRLEITLLRTAP